MPIPMVEFSSLESLWIQITGTWCNLECTHCFNASGPREPWLASLDAAAVRRAIAEAAELGVKAIYFTGGEPFLHRDLLALLRDALAVASTTVLTNGTLITEAVVDALASLAATSRYSFEVRVSLDDADPARNDLVRGAGAHDKAVRAIRLLTARGLLPIVTATELLADARPGDGEDGLYGRLRDFLLSVGVGKPRIKILPVLPIGRQAQGAEQPRVTEAMLEDFDRSTLQCTHTRAVAAGGVYACPILAGLPGARLSSHSLAEAMRPCALYHPACVTCVETGLTCGNA